MNDGAGGTIFTEQDQSSVENLPALREHTITSFGAVDTSKTYQFYMRAENSVGLVQTDTVSYVLAAVPDKPTTVPLINY